MASLPPKRKKSRTRPAAAEFTERQVWEPFGLGWRKLHGSFHEAGYSIEWHDFTTQEPFDWSKTFHPGSVEICLNISGNGGVQSGEANLELAPLTGGFYAQNGSALAGSRRGGERHQFITIELSIPFLRNHLPETGGGLHPGLARFLGGRERRAGMVSESIRLSSEQQQLAQSFQKPPVFLAAQGLWYHAKVLEAASAFLYQASANEGLFCERQHHLNRERTQKVLAILKESLANPPSLEELGRRVGCSHFYLSRIFTQEMGKTITVTVRDLRMERAAALLREGRMNVTEVALEVGYSSLSHFSSAFHEVIGCCPGLYPLAPGPKNG